MLLIATEPWVNIQFCMIILNLIEFNAIQNMYIQYS